MSVTATRDRFFELARDEINLGSWYNPWFPDKDWDSIMYMNCSQVPNHLTDSGANCASLFNWIRCWMNLDPIGGCGDYNGNGPWYFWEPFNINKNYPPFTLLAAPYNGAVIEQQGHVAIVSSWEDENHNQMMIQSDAFSAWHGTWGEPGPNESRTMNDTDQELKEYDGYTFYWAGQIVDQPILDGFPGYQGSQGKERAMWTAECMAELGRDFGVVIPGFYAANMILAELPRCLDPNEELYDIKLLPGYSPASPTEASDGRWGPAQLSANDWPIPWSFSFTVACLARALYTRAKSEGLGELPSAQQDAAETIQAVLQSNKTAADYAAQYERACELTEF